MKKLLLILLAATVQVAAMAQTPQQVLDQCVAALKGSGPVSATYAMSSQQGSSSGTIVMNGNKFRILSGDVKCWFDGTTMWTYSRATGEVSVTTPTASDLAMTSPYAIAQNYKSGFTAAKSTASGSTYVAKLTPKRRSNITQALLTVNTSSRRISKMVVHTKNAGIVTITISGYKTKVSAGQSTFKFDKKLVPAGTQVVDLR